MSAGNKYRHQAKVFKALADPNRLLIMEMLRSGERCACELLEGLHIRQPTLSHHMKLLCEAGLVSGRREGKWMYYSFNREGCKAIREFLDEITSEKENNNLGGRRREC